MCQKLLRLLNFMVPKWLSELCISIYTWNPNDPYFLLDKALFWRVEAQKKKTNRFQVYIYIYMIIYIYILCLIEFCQGNPPPKKSMDFFAFW